MERSVGADREPPQTRVAVADAWTSEASMAVSDVGPRRVAEAPPLLDGDPGATDGGASSAPLSLRELPAVQARPSPQTTFLRIDAAAASTVDTIGGRPLPTRSAADPSIKIFIGLPMGVNGDVCVTDRRSMRPAPIRARAAPGVDASSTGRPDGLQPLPQSMPLHLRLQRRDLMNAPLTSEPLPQSMPLHLRLQRRDLINAPLTTASSPPLPPVSQSLAANQGAARPLGNDNMGTTQLAYTTPSPPPLAALPEPTRPAPQPPVCFAPPASPAAAAADTVFPPNCPAPSPHVADAPAGEPPAAAALLWTCDICFQELPPTMFGSVASCGHPYCRPCLSAHWRTRIVDGCQASPACPRPGCRAVATMDDVTAAGGPDAASTARRLRYLRSLAAAVGDPTARWCAIEGCRMRLPPAATATTATAAADGGTVVSCLACGHLNCLDCGGYHPADGVCPLSSTTSGGGTVARGVDPLYAAWAANRVGACPTCGAHIEKAGGCDTVVCTACGRAFTWFPFGRLEAVSPSRVTARRFRRWYRGPRSCHALLGALLMTALLALIVSPFLYGFVVWPVRVLASGGTGTVTNVSMGLILGLFGMPMVLLSLKWAIALRRAYWWRR